MSLEDLNKQKDIILKQLSKMRTVSPVVALAESQAKQLSSSQALMAERLREASSDFKAELKSKDERISELQG